MIPNKLCVKTALKLLKNNENFLVRFSIFNGIIRNKHWEEVGTLSTKVIDKLIQNNYVEFICYGEGLLNHEMYYRIK